MVSREKSNGDCFEIVERIIFFLKTFRTLKMDSKTLKQLIQDSKKSKSLDLSFQNLTTIPDEGECKQIIYNRRKIPCTICWCRRERLCSLCCGWLLCRSVLTLLICSFLSDSLQLAATGASHAE
jgi:hypothetical protein